VIMGKAFDVTHSYQTLLSQLALLTLAAAALMLFLPRYNVVSSGAAGASYPTAASTATVE